MDREIGVVVVGAGAAGLMAACTAAPDAETVLVTDRALGACNSAMAQGGLQVPRPDAESRERFLADMLRSARVPVDEALVRRFVEQVGSCVDELEQWGLMLDRDGNGALLRQWAGGLSDPRIVSVGDGVGTALMRVLHARVESLGIEVVTHTQVVGIDPHDGCLALRVRDREGALSTMRARSVVAATGGLTFRIARGRGESTTNPVNENHVLYDALCGLGLERVHEEFFQYQPFGIVSFDTGSVGRCVPESIVNLPVRLLDRNGDAVCDLGLDRLEVANAMTRSIHGGDGYVTADGKSGLRLTLSDIGEDQVRARFSKLALLLERHSALGDDVLVRPFLHYQLGGFRVALDGTTTVAGLYLAGEMTGGLHGRNRLMGNGITESLVRGRLSGAAAVRWLGGSAGAQVQPTS